MFKGISERRLAVLEAYVIQSGRVTCKAKRQARSKLARSHNVSIRTGWSSVDSTPFRYLAISDRSKVRRGQK